jgi:hypothetical protein
MAKQNRIVLKGYFNTGDTPTEEQFADLIDSFAISLSELGDINLSGLQDGFILAFNQGTNKWIVRNLPIPVYALSELDDVDLTGAIDTNVLVFSQTLNKWVPGSITIPMITAGDGLKKVGEIISLGLPSNLGATSVNSVSGETHTHSIDSSIARSERIISGGEGLIGGGDLTEDRVISLSEHTHQESGTSGGKLDHGLALDGLTDDDHPQYWNDTRGSNKIDQHISADDHIQYWNDARGDPKVENIAADVANTKVSDHNLIKTAHGLVSPSAINDFMIASGIGVWSKKTLEEAKSILGVINENDILAVTDLLYSPINHTHEVATTVEKGFMSPSDKSKLDGLDANNYAPIAHVGSGGSAHADVTASVDGFMKAADKAKLDGLDANNYAPIGHVGSGGTAHADVTTSVDGFMKAADKVKLDGLNSENYAPVGHVGSGGAAHADVTTSVDGFMKAEDKVKLNALSMQLIQTITLASAGTIYFTSIPQTFNHLKLIGAVRSSRASTNDAFALRFNNDSGANYNNVYANIKTTGLSMFMPGATTAMSTILVDAANSNSNHLTPIDILIPYYSTARRRVFHGMGFAFGNYNTDTTILQLRGSNYAIDSVITSLMCMLETGSLIAGSTLSLYGLM